MLTCGACGLSCDYRDSRYFSFGELKPQYRVGFADVCGKCGNNADSFICYYGKKAEKDLTDLHNFLISGIVPTNDFLAMMNAGYRR